MILLFFCKCKVLFYINSPLFILLTEFKGINHSINKIDLFQWLTTPLKHYEISVTFRNKFSHNNFKMYSLSDQRLALKGDECEVDRHWYHCLPEYRHRFFKYGQLKNAQTRNMVRSNRIISARSDGWAIQRWNGNQWKIYAAQYLQHHSLQPWSLAKYEVKNYLPWNAREWFWVLPLPFQVRPEDMPPR